MKVMDWLFRREVLTDQEIDLVKVMEVKRMPGATMSRRLFLKSGNMASIPLWDAAICGWA